MARYSNSVPEVEIRNNYSQRYLKQQRLLALKKVSVAAVANASMHIPLSSPSSLITSTASVPKFDAILIGPPYSSSFSWDELENMPIPKRAADPLLAFSG
ncbi:hypothetical protein FRB90_012126 [Tulasnella sp. 427]|nr:hypothetical protein FRB90_012126 [Tulasnella sp. 427]